MRIFVTGADGFIGQHLLPRFNNHEICALDYDLRDHKAVSAQLLEFCPDIIIHLAARTEVEQSFYEQITFSDINYTGTVNLIETARHLPNLQNFVFASTMEVYGWHPMGDLIRRMGLNSSLHTEFNPKNPPAFDEDTPCNPNAPYAVAKYGCEKYLEYAGRSYRLPYTILRQTNTYGRKDNDFFVTEQIIHQMLKNSDEIFLGYGKPYRNFLYIDDLIDAWDIVVNNPDKVIGEIFCLGPDNALSIESYVDMIAEKLAWAGKVIWNTKPERPGEIYLLNSTNRKLTDATGWSPKVDLDTGLRYTIDFWKEKVAKER